MLAILNITLPLFLLIGVGYSATKLGFLSLEHNRGLGSFVLNLPSLPWCLMPFPD